jgi:polyisoprenoid-binding protein YceI
MLPLFLALTLKSLAVFSALSTTHAGHAMAARGAVAGPAGAGAQQARRLRLSLAPTGNEARYKVREQLFGFDFPNDAIGKTDKISGSLVLESNGRIVREESKFTVALATIASDRAMRDNYVRNNTLQVAQYPNAEFIPDTATGLPAALPAAADLAFKLTGDFTVHGVTRPTTWDVKGRMAASGEFTGTATTWFRFGDFNMTVPRVRLVLSVADSITLEMDVKLVPGG